MVPRCATPYSYIGGCTLNIRDYLANTFIVEENIFFAIYTVVIKGRLYKQLAKYLQRAKQLFEFKFKTIMTLLYCSIIVDFAGLFHYRTNPYFIKFVFLWAMPISQCQ